MSVKFNAQLLEAAILSFLDERHSGFLASIKKAGADSKALSDIFTKTRSSLGNYMDDPKLRAAYAAHFTITNAAKAFFCLNLISDSIGAANFSPDSFLDLGSGLGAATFASSMFLSGRSPDSSASFAMVDSSKDALRDSNALFNYIRGKNQAQHSACLTTDPASLKKYSTERYKVVFASNLLNEMNPDSARELCECVLRDLLSDDGFFIIVEPALREQTRNLMALRDSLVSNSIASIFSPCLHDKPCPMLSANDRDWCHFYIDWNPPNIIKELDDAAGTNHKYLKFAYAIFQKTTNPTRQTSVYGKSCRRAVSSLIVTRGKKELMLCGSSGELRKTRRLDKNESDANATFADCARGDVLETSAEVDIKKEDVIRVVQKWPAM